MKQKTTKERKAFLFLCISLSVIVLFVFCVCLIIGNRNKKIKAENTVTSTVTESSVKTAEKDSKKSKKTKTAKTKSNKKNSQKETTVKPESKGTFENPLTITIDSEKWYLTLVNSNYRIPDDYSPELVNVCGTEERLEKRVAKAYEEMFEAAAKEDVYLTPCSGYRSYDLQKSNYENETTYYENLGYSHKEALKKAATVIMPPGSSEHNLGFAMDIVCVEEWFEDTDEYTWLNEHAADYGFILRYPEDKTDITKVIYEPWHWRYVGTEYAKKIKASGKCMEEYFGVY